MNKIDIINDLNCKSKIYRTIQTDEKLTFEVGQIINNLGNSWSNEYGVFTVENERKYEYFFRCDVPVACHEVDYDNEEECEVLGAEGCENECEMLVPNETKFRVINVSSDEDYEIMKYYEVELEPVI